MKRKRNKDRRTGSPVAAWILLAAALMGVGGCRFSSAAKPARRDADVALPNPAELARALFERSNELRRSKQLDALRWNEQMARSAQAHAEAMADARRMSHDGFRERADDLRRRGVVSRATENVAYGMGLQDPAQTTVSNWSKSTVHRRNLLEPGDRLTGVGCALTADGYFYFVQLYGR